MTEIWDKEPPLAKHMPEGTLIMRTGGIYEPSGKIHSFIALESFTTPPVREESDFSPDFRTRVRVNVYDVDQQLVRCLVMDFSTSWKYYLQDL